MMHPFSTIPDRWAISQLDRVASVNARIGWKALTAKEYQPEGYVFLATPNIKNAHIDYQNVNYISEFRYEESPELKLNPGDVLLAKDGNTLGITNIVRTLPHPATVNGSIAVLRPFDIEPRFLKYVIESNAIQGLIAAAKDGMGVPHLFQRDITRFPIPLPPLNEQRRIADFLDAETARIDQLTSIRERQIELLTERDFASAFNALKGGDRTGKRRPSRLAWLGNIPDSWPVLSVGSQFEVKLGKMLNSEQTTGEYLRPYLRNVNVQWGRINTDDLLYMNFPPSERRRYEVLSGDLLICEGGEPGRAATWDGESTEIYYQKALHRVRPNGNSSVRWLYYCMRAAVYRNVFAAEGNTTTIAHLTGEQLRAHRFPFPDRDDQDEIVAELDETARRSASLIHKLNRQLELLTERRQALITAAVTGQFDVTAADSKEAA